MDTTRTLLLVEDNPGDVRLVVEMLRDFAADVAVTGVETQAAAMDRLAQGDVDVVLLDLGLPDSQGLETFTRLHDAAPGIAIIVLTGNSDLGLAVRAVEQGAQDFLVKDHVNGELLTRSINYAIERKHAEQELAESEARYRALAEGSPLSVLVCHSGKDDDEVILVNAACVELFGASSPEELIGRSALDLFDRLSQPLVRGPIREATSATVPFVGAQIVRIDGTLVDVDIAAAPLLDQGMAATQVVLRDITELKKAHEQAARLAAIVTSSPDAIFTKDLHETVTNWNPAAEALYGYTAEEIIGTNMEVLVPRGRKGASRKLTERLRRGESIEQFETQCLRKDGSLIDVALALFPIRNDAGNVAAISITARDISDRKQAEQKRLRAEKFFEDTFEHANVGIAHVNSTDGTWLRVNQCLCDMLGYSREELMATTFAALTHPDDVEENVRHLHRMLAGKQGTYAADKRYLRKDGSTICVHLNVVLIRKEDGTPDYNLSVLTDITEGKRAEEELRESEEKFRELFNNAEVGMFRTKLDGSELLDLNDKYLEILGYAREELIGKPSVIVWADPREREAMTRTLEETGRVVGLEFDLLTKQGDVRRCLTSLRLYRDKGILEGSITDITERKRRADLAARQAERIERTLTSVIDIAGNIGEMRDPYTAGHQRRVAELAARMAQELGMSDSEVANIQVAGLLHDVGKTAVPTEILSKPGTITPVEFDLIKSHAEAGYRIAVSANMEEPIPDLIHQHHERCDGSGYPLGLLGDQILPGAKVLAVADVVEAMMSHRPYRPALGIEEALAEIERGAGSLYDAEVSRVCVALFRTGGFEFSP